MEIYSDKAKWDRGVELAYAANEARDRLVANTARNEELAEKLVEPYINHFSGTIQNVWHPDRYFLLSKEVEEALSVENKALSKTFWTLSRLVGELIGRKSGVQDPYSDMPRVEE